MNKWMNEWMDEWMNAEICVCVWGLNCNFYYLWNTFFVGLASNAICPDVKVMNALIAEMLPETKILLF